MREGDYDEEALERQLNNRGLMFRFFGRWMKTIDKEWKIYPVGVVFGMGFDTATEVALLATTALLASQHLPFYAILCLPILFTAGMCLMDTIDGIFMNFAYSWAFFNPVRKVYYNLAITALSVAICFFIGTVEVLSLLPTELGGLHGSFWHYVEVFDINKAGFVIVGMFVVCWAGALAFWRFGRVEERWSARLKQRRCRGRRCGLVRRVRVKSRPSLRAIRTVVVPARRSQKIRPIGDVSLLHSPHTGNLVTTRR